MIGPSRVMAPGTVHSRTQSLTWHVCYDITQKMQLSLSCLLGLNALVIFQVWLFYCYSLYDNDTMYQV